jgi:prolyl oligopeptidase
MRTLATGVLLGLAAIGTAQAQKSAQPQDNYRWLEEVSADKSLAWVRQHNAVAQTEIEGRPEFAGIHARLKTILNAKERIPYVSKQGDYYYNFWRDPQHVRGIWRRTTLAQFGLPEPAWETVIDLDQLARDENENWVWGGVSCLLPKGERCLVSLSRGGGDAHVVREFDTAARAFVKDGFVLPEAKGGASWIDLDTVFVATDFGPGSMSSSGYPRIVKEWKRGAPLAQARTLFEAQAGDMSAHAYKDFTPGYEQQFVERQVTFYSSEMFVREGDKLTKVAKPDDANAYTVRDQLVIELRSDWEAGGKRYPQGALLATDFKRFMAGEREFEVLFAPTASTSLDGVAVTRSALLLNTLDNVKNRIVELRHVDGKWQRRAVDAPAFGSLGVSALDPIGSDQYFLTVTDFLTPTTLYLGEVGSDRRAALKALPAFFDAKPYTVTQYQATSKDGTKVPYFVVMNKHTKMNGKNPTVLYGYGGFEISMKPSYSGVSGEAWLKNGGVYVLANIRGGGEFGPRWHQAALKEHRQRAYDDFIAVAQDLIERKVSSPRHLGIMGGSNGGLLVGAVMTQRPDLFNAVVCQVPLLDMRRYNQLLAGASWMGEYGDPDDPAQWAYISKYSPYQNVFKDKHYPRVLFTTSTRDDRVHPGHARKMVALMQEQGHDVLYWENTEGGHAGAANNDQQAQMWALTYTFLLNQLK